MVEPTETLLAQSLRERVEAPSFACFRLPALYEISGIETEVR